MPRRGAFRGGRRGRGNARRGRGTSHYMHSRRNLQESNESKDVVLDVNSDPEKFFTSNVSVDQHYQGQTSNLSKYTAALGVLCNNNYEIPQNARVRALASAWARQDTDLVEALFCIRDSFGLVEILKALQLLDIGRQIRVKEKRFRRLQLSKNKVSAKTIGKIKAEINNLENIKPQHGSASGAVCKHVQKWVRTLTKEQLEFYALHFPKDPWMKLADLCHLNPEKDFVSLPWFLPYCFGKEAPEGSMIHQCQNLTEENVNSLVKEFSIPFTHITRFKQVLNTESKACIAANEPKLDTVLWWYDDLKCSEVDEVILSRLDRQDKITLPDGKLIDRLLLMKRYRENIKTGYGSFFTNNKQRKLDPSKSPFFDQLVAIANKRLENIVLPLESPIVVSGDASDSMSIAIQTSSIIAGLLTTVCTAKLVFFNNKIFYPESLPTNIEEVLELAVTTKASCSTSPAASLWPFYEKKEVIKTFIIVTDEEENTPCQSYRFAPLYDKYYKEVYPMKLVFVSFLRYQHAEGHMVRELSALGYQPLVFKFHNSDPDLTKLDKMFAALVAEGATFSNEIESMEQRIKSHGLRTVYTELAKKE